MKKAEQIQQAVEGWKASGLTQQVYCRQIGVKRSTFANWVKRSKEKTFEGFKLLSPCLKEPEENLELIYPNGVRLRVSLSGLRLLPELIRAC